MLGVNDFYGLIRQYNSICRKKFDLKSVAALAHVYFFKGEHEIKKTRNVIKEENIT